MLSIWPRPAGAMPAPLDIPRLDAPIVLAHGLFGFRRIGLGPLTLAWYFRDIPGLLERAGNRVLLTRVHPTAGIDRRAWKLKWDIRAGLPDDGPFHLVGHSMGGLDCRALMLDPAWRRRVLSLTTIGTPHLGSSLADHARARAPRVLRLLERLQIDHRGFFDLAPDAVARFNRRAPLPDDLPAFSIAGNPSEADVCWPLRRSYAALAELEGPNDGLVSVESALGVGEPLPPWPIDHFRQMNWLPAATPATNAHSPGAPTVADLYAGVVRNLARHGFAADDQTPPAEPDLVAADSA